MNYPALGRIVIMVILVMPQPVTVEQYHRHMGGGGVDKSDQFLAYHNVLWKTVRYWKTLFIVP